jgi:hypothetical protein
MRKEQNGSIFFLLCFVARTDTRTGTDVFCSRTLKIWVVYSLAIEMYICIKMLGQLNIVNHDFGHLDEVGHFSTENPTNGYY